MSHLVWLEDFPVIINLAGFIKKKSNIFLYLLPPSINSDSKNFNKLYHDKIDQYIKFTLLTHMLGQLNN